MKKFFSILVVFSLALLIGCQENLINEPETATLNKGTESVSKNVLKICCEFQDPYYGTCKLNGCVTYTHKIVAISVNPMNSIYEVALHIDMDSELSDLTGIVHLPWRVQGWNEEIVNITEREGVTLRRYYEITNRNDVILGVEYLVTLEGIEIGKIWLEQIY